MTGADGTVTINNFATDRVVDLIVLSYVNLSSLWYEIAGDSVVIRVINSKFPVLYDGSRPAVILASFMKGSEYQHVNLETADEIITNLTSFISSPASGLPATDSPSPEGVLSNLYISLGILLVLGVFVGFVVLGAYKVCCKQDRKQHQDRRGYEAMK